MSVCTAPTPAIRRMSNCILSTWPPSTQGRIKPLLSLDDLTTSKTSKSTKITGSVVTGLQSRVDIAAISLVASRGTRLSSMPSRAADPSIELQMLNNGRAGGPVTAASLKHCQPVLVQAARATYSVRQTRSFMQRLADAVLYRILWAQMHSLSTRSDQAISCATSTSNGVLWLA
jgi:hypothetical protein